MSAAFRTTRAQLLVECLDLEAASGVEGARWEHFQLALFNDDSKFRIENKSRQIAWSFSLAADFLADAILNAQDGLFVSINLEEATEKIRYARTIYENLRTPFPKPPLIRDNELALEMMVPHPRTGQLRRTRLISLPGKAPRGKPRFNVGLDEFAHSRDDRRIYKGALPVISKGGRLRIGSSPMGASGVFWEVMEQKLQKYPRFRRKVTPWWHIQAFVPEGLLKEAVSEAPYLTTRDRVMAYGNDTLQAVFESMVLEDFQQEYECLFVDEVTAWITWEEIQANQVTDLKHAKAVCQGTDTTGARLAVAQLQGMMARSEVEARFVAGLDVGRSRNATELFLLGWGPAYSYPIRLMITMEGMPFREQYGIVAHVVKSLPVVKCLVDRNGLGMQLAEDLAFSFPAKVEGVDFTQPAKIEWATNAKVLCQNGKTPLPVDRELAYQIHSIKRLVTPTHNLVFDTDRNEKHHADKFWAWALALSAVQGAATRPPARQHNYAAALADEERREQRRQRRMPA